MRRRYTEEQIIAILNESRAGAKTGELARRTIEAWRISYNTNRPHSGLGVRTPAEFAKMKREDQTQTVSLELDPIWGL